ncbi:MAG TPA: hypothetical protein VEP66_20980 [Myxococcales bacterium]|nr:hypothetical protein [Myxococcales bacterium]
MRIFAVILLLAGAARAGGNDLQLWRLGHPDAMPCTICDGSAGDPAQPGVPGAQAHFHRMASTLGLAFIPAFQEPAATTGQAGFEVGIGSNQAFLHLGADTWPSVNPPPSVLVMPAVTVRKGLGGSFELGAAVQWLTDSEIMAISGELRWAVTEGLTSGPDVALRVWGTRVVGAQDLDLASAGADALVSKSFGVGGMMKVQPYGSFGLAMVNAFSAAIDFKPTAEDQARPGIDDQVFHPITLFNNRYWRAVAGARMVVGSVVAGIEGSVSWGTNEIQDGVSAGSNFVRLWSLAGRFGATF